MSDTPRDRAAKAASRRRRATRSSGARRVHRRSARSTRSSRASSTSATAAGAASASATRSRRCSTPSTRSPSGEVDGVPKHGVLAGRRALLPLRHVLHDEVPVRAAAPVERRLPAPDAAREGQALQDGKARAARQDPELDGRGRQARRHSGRRRGRERGQRARSSAASCSRRRSACTATRRCRSTTRSSARTRLKDRVGRDAEPKPAAARAAASCVFATCYGNRNQPGLVEDLVAVLEHNGIASALAGSERCCGMPKLELGDLEVDRAAQGGEHPRARPATLATAGTSRRRAVVRADVQAGAAAVVPRDERVRRVAEAFFDPFEYLMLRHRDGKLRTDFATSARQDQLSGAVPPARAEHRAEDARRAAARARHESASRSSAARATTAPTA